jgi:hypothetical protein
MLVEEAHRWLADRLGSRDRDVDSVGTLRNPRRSLAVLAGFAASVIAGSASSGAIFWLLLGVALASLLGLLGLMLGGAESRRPARYLVRGAVVGLSVCAGLAACEGILWALELVLEIDVPEEWVGAPVDAAERDATIRSLVAVGDAGDLSVHLAPEIRTKMERMQNAITFPPAWERRKLATVAGRRRPYYWHRALHVLDENEMRKQGPFPPRDGSRFRIMVVGDSFTYGAGIDRYWTYPEQLARALGRDYAVEVLNLGISGHGSEDVYATVRRFLSQLTPDLVIYGVCLNDFLPSGAEEHLRYRFPIPEEIEQFLTRRTRVGRLVQNRYGALLLRLGLRSDFYSDLLTDLEARSAHFGRAVGDMNALVTALGLPPVIALVLDQFPQVNGPGWQLAMEAERQMRAAGMTVIDSRPYYRQFDGRRFTVSRWEAHPNEEAHAIFAKLLVPSVRDLPSLRPYSK